MEEALVRVETDLGVRATLDYTRGVPPVVNEEGATRQLERAARAVLGSAAVVDATQSAGGDDFSWYLEQVPGSYARLGVNDPSDGREALDLHAGNFDVDERAIGVGIRVLVEAALDTLAGAGPP
ncbi:MAG: M20/M25/M40 family metallo-hydrolase [Acidimicrobiia bacterium]|nr:M20/M25/M40 family metallo-hydrolase [Acidimicrobiia bacterium]